MASETPRTNVPEDVRDYLKYRPIVQPKNIIIQRCAANFGAPVASKQVRLRDGHAQYRALGLPPNAYASLSRSGISAVKEAREQEKKDMQDLNTRFLDYIEKTRFLEAQNRKLEDELSKLKARWGQDTSKIKAKYEVELGEARRLLDEAFKDKSRLEIRLASMEEVTEELRQRLEDALKDAAGAKEKFEHQNQQLADFEGEVGLLRRRLASLEGEREKERGLIKKIQDGLNAARSDLDNETLLHIDAENRRQTLEEELEFLKGLHEQELKELQALAYRDSTSENREYWKSEMGQALREIQQAYDEKIDVMRGELETYYNLKIQEFRTGATRNNMESVHFKEEGKRLRDQMTSLRDKLSEQENRIAQLMRELESVRREKEERERELELKNGELTDECVKLRAEMEAMLKELQIIIDAKLGLELEIAAYRRLLDGEESRSGLRQIVDSALSTSSESHEYNFRQTDSTSGDASMRVSQITKGEMSAKTTYQKSAKGPVAIYECSPDGKFVALENTGRKDEVLSGWSLTRNIDGKDAATYKFKDSFILRPAEKIKVWSKGSKPSVGAAPGDIESDHNWGIGSHIITRLINPLGEDRASHVQQTKYA